MTPIRHIVLRHGSLKANSPQLGAQASAAFDEADNGKAIIYLPAIVAAELYFMNKKLNGAIDFNKEITGLFQAGQFVFVP